MARVWTIDETISASVEFLPTFTTSGLLISVEGNRQPTWIKAGYLKIWAVIDGELFDYSTKLIKFGNSVISIGIKEYKLSFELADYLIAPYNPTLKISPFNIHEIMDILNPLPTSIGDQPVTDSVPTTFSAPQYLPASLPATYQALPANPARQGLAIVNNGTAPVYIDLDAPTGLTKRLSAIAVGGVFNLGFVYQGAVFAWSSNATAQSLEVREFIQ
jgi:hypothetical protein